ncbi:MAG: hypothetical protein KAS59_09535 [Alphaproteobacteria bacterium]|nr:hypothetical protein [Alphaproteobacteria bacterium]MCK5556381.1 hypothetical protein [Alphaproteobacteria bacterium]MCK5659617.1 hypothetical protein [Alphaproteobacteria bacterium]
MAKKLTIKTVKDPVLQIYQHVLKEDKLVYIAVANKKIKYKNGKSSRIVYIGRTERGVKRIAKSAAVRAEKLLKIHGLKHLEFYIITSEKKQKLETWKKLESAAILAFRGEYGQVPKGNINGKNKEVTDEFEYFERERILKILEKHS